MQNMGAKLYCGARAFVWTEKAFDKETLKVTDKPLRDELIEIGTLFFLSCEIS
jgi:hypothetical protein